jgi:hypothetical protein
MKLEALINIKFSFNSDKLTITWKTEEELLKYITDLVKSFEDSDEGINGPKTVVDKIISLKDKIKTYELDTNRIEIDLQFLERMKEADAKSNLKQGEYDRMEKVINNKIEREKSKNGDPYIELTREEFYDILSLQKHRDNQLNKLA